MLAMMKELQKLHGVGEVLSRRFVEAGYATFAKVAAAGEEGLRKIPGINPRMIDSILAQAMSLAAATVTSKARQAEELKQRATALKEQVQTIALSVRDRFRDDVAGKGGKKLEKEILKVLDTLERVEGRLETKVKKSGKALLKAEARLEGLSVAGLKKIGKGLKKARKSLKTIGS